MTLEDEIMKLQTYKMFEGEDTVYVERDDILKLLEQEPCDDCISRQAVEKITWEEPSYTDALNVLTEVRDKVRALPPVKLQEPKTGHWIKTPKAVMGEGYMWYCDKCEHQVYQDSSKPYPSEKYCPNCGRRMVESQESEKSDDYYRGAQEEC